MVFFELKSIALNDENQAAEFKTQPPESVFSIVPLTNIELSQFTAAKQFILAFLSCGLVTAYTQ